MQKNWYITYTKPKCEKKVASTFTKRKIEHFLPLNCKQLHPVRKGKIISEPLFESYIFAFLSVEDISKIRKIEGVLNLLYWKGEPATIRENEIEAIREFTTDHHNIKLEKTQIDLNGQARVVNGPQYLMARNILTIKNKVVKVNLPSLGVTMVAEISPNNLFNDKVSFGNKELLFQS